MPHGSYSAAQHFGFFCPFKPTSLSTCLRDTRDMPSQEGRPSYSRVRGPASSSRYKPGDRLLPSRCHVLANILLTCGWG